jgi:hypothetical protein
MGRENNTVHQMRTLNAWVLSPGKPAASVHQCGNLTNLKITADPPAWWYTVTIVFVLTSTAFGYYGLNKRLTDTHTAGMILGILFLAWSLTMAIFSSIFVWHPGTFIPMMVMLLIGVLGIIGAREVLSYTGVRNTVTQSP